MDLDLTNDEVVVLAGLLDRYSNTGCFVLEDQAEQRALWNLQCVLETVVGGCYEGYWTAAHSKALEDLRDEPPTKSVFKKQYGCIALWLEASEIEFLLDESQKISESEPESVRQRWGKLAVSCKTALNKVDLYQEFGDES